MTDLNLKGKTAMITGASKGIGHAIAQRLAKEGVNVVLAARTKATLDEAVKEIKSQSKAKIIGVPCDVSRLEDLQKLVNVAMKELGDRKSVV